MKKCEATTHWFNILSQTGAARLQTPSLSVVAPLVPVAPQNLF